MQSGEMRFVGHDVFALIIMFVRSWELSVSHALSKWIKGPVQG